MSDRLRDEIQAAINRSSAENGSNTPDFILAEYLVACLAAYDQATLARESWYGMHLYPGGVSMGTRSAALAGGGWRDGAGQPTGGHENGS